MSEKKEISPLYKGIILIVMSAFFFAFMNMFVRLSGELPALQKSFFRNLIAFICAGAVLAKNKQPIKVPKNAWLPLLLRAGFGTVGIFCNFYALGILDLADASILNKMSPFFEAKLFKCAYRSCVYSLVRRNVCRSCLYVCKRSGTEGS